MMVPVGRLTLVRTFAKSELVRAMSFVAIPGLVGPMLGPLAGGLIVGYLHWRVIFFLNIPIGIAGSDPGLSAPARLPRTDQRKPLDIVGLILFGVRHRVAVLCAGDLRRAHAQPGEMLGLLAISLALLFGYGLHATRHGLSAAAAEPVPHPHLRAAVSGSFFTRLGIGGVPFLLPLLYQVGLGLTPVQSGLLIMPQAVAAMSTKFFMPTLLDRVGYRAVLVSNTVILGLLLMLFATIGPGTPIWLIVLQAFCYGALPRRNTPA